MKNKDLNVNELNKAVVSLQAQSQVLLDIINLYIEYGGNKEEFEGFLRAKHSIDKNKVELKKLNIKG